MKKWILWSFDRGSFQYDVLCGLILLTIFAIPPELFNDRPDYMRLPPSGEIGMSIDDDQNEVYTVKTERDLDAGLAEREALARLEAHLGRPGPLDTFRVEAVRNTRGSIEAYAFWVK
jgi:hypothetical protein